MSAAATIARDPQWLPHALDMGARQMGFLRIARADISAPAFLADRQPAAPADLIWLPFGEVLAMRPATGPLHFIFHTAFCRSTLLVRALDVPGLCAGLSEPGIIAALANAGEAARPLMRPVLDLLSRPHRGEHAVFVKPTNHANRLMPMLLAARPDAKAVLMTNALPAFLGALVRRGLLGRRWGRQLYLELMGYAGMDLGMDAREQFSMTDLQAAALGWFLAQHWFAAHLGGADGAPLRVLDGDRFDAARGETLLALADFTGLSLPQHRAKEIVASALFSEHAKLGGTFAAGAPPLDKRAAEEITQVGQWIGMIAQQAGLTVPLAQTLF